MLDLNIHELELWAAGFVERLQPAARRKLLRELAIITRRANQQRMTKQQDPNNTKWAPRKNKRNKQTARMFKKIKLAKFLKISLLADGANIGWQNNSARIARYHQFGLRQQFKNGAIVKYEKRELIGINAADKNNLLQHILDYLTP